LNRCFHSEGLLFRSMRISLLIFLGLIFTLITTDIIQLNFILFLILEYPVGASLFNAALFNKWENVLGICPNNVRVKERLLTMRTRELLCFYKFIFLDNPILMVTDCAFLHVMHHIVKPHIQAGKGLQLFLCL
jgi:hypothetical protein